MSDETARAVVVRGLKTALAAHHDGRVLDIGDGWDDAAAMAHNDRRLSIALSLWEDWADSTAHEWLFYPGLTADDWPRFAGSVIDALEHDREIVDAQVLRHFVRMPRAPSALARFITKVKSLFGSD